MVLENVSSYTEFHDSEMTPVWNLYERALQRTGPTATLLEWDDPPRAYTDAA